MCIVLLLVNYYRFFRHAVIKVVIFWQMYYPARICHMILIFFCWLLVITLLLYLLSL